MKRLWKFAVLLFAGAPLLLGCAQTNAEKKSLEREDEIITFEAPKEGKDVIRIGFAMKMNWDPLIAILNAKFPTKQFIYDFDATSGIDLPLETAGQIVEKNNYDFVVANYWNAPSLGAEISSESFLDNYLPTALNAIQSGGRIYGIPLPISAQGIYYNQTLFEQNGWALPASSDELISLASTIAKTGVTPFDCCFKYEGQLTRVLQGMIQDELFSKPEGMAWYTNLLAGKAKFADYLTPAFTLAKSMFDNGVFSLKDFSASLTTMRKDFFAGKIAMLDYSSDIYSLANSEGCSFKIGLAPYPSTTGKNSPVLYSSSAILYIPKAIKADASRYAFDTSVLSYLSTSEGQDALLTGWSGVPSVKNYESKNNDLYSKVKPFIESGAYHPSLDFAPSQAMIKPLKILIRDAVESIGKGTAVAEAIATLDTAFQATLEKGIATPTYQTIATATDDFTVLDTSYYEADKIKAATSADVALVPNSVFYRSNMAFIKKGDITNDSRIFYQKGIASSNPITTYSLTGATLKNLLEKPIINGTETDQFIAASGLKMTYSPWQKRGSRIRNLALADGSAFDESKNYTVAAYAGVVDQSFASTSVATFPKLGDPQTFVIASLTADKTITPDLKGRLTLDWSVAQ
jgi:raffinose/stachyose/melibiose transport system substrate-binding protein